MELLATYDAEQREQYGESEADICDICRGTCLRCHITHTPCRLKPFNCTTPS